MANEPNLNVQERTTFGSAACRRLRREGVIPGNVYGHGIDPVPIAAREEDVTKLVTEGSRLVNLKLEGRNQQGMFREVQWDTFGKRIQHFDMVRIKAGERVTVEVPVELKGYSQDQFEGGVLEQPLRTLTIECPAADIPDAIDLNIGELEIGQSVQVRDVTLPEGAVAQNPEDAVVVHVGYAAVEEEEPEEAEVGPEEPELVGRKAEEEGEEEQAQGEKQEG